MTSSAARRVALALAALVIAAYGNSFHNAFHFDDDHAIVDNPFVRSVRFVPRYFVDARTFSVLPPNQSYRPVTQTTFAIDYAIHGYDPLAFHVDTFVWFAALLVALCVLVAALTGSTGAALAATAAFGLHPAVADTVNYIVQRGEIIAALGVVAGLALFVRAPASRRAGWYLAPVVAGILAKQSAVVFPPLLAAYLWSSEQRIRTRDVALSAVVTALTAAWVAARTPPSTVYGTSPAILYRLTQPFVALRYAWTFVAPVSLSVDYDWSLVDGAGDPRVLAGVVFIGGLAVAIWRLRRSTSTRTAAFGLAWFLIAQLPTAIVPLSEVANDWRMLLPFVGLAIAVGGAVAHVVGPEGASRRASAGVRVGTAAAIVAVAIAEAAGVRARNEVWRTDVSLWRDAAAKSPENARAWMNLGVALMGRGDYGAAAEVCERALVLAPAYTLVHVNLGVAYGEIDRQGDAEREFLTAQRLAPDDWRTHVYYGRWLEREGRAGEARRELERARALNPAAP